MITPNSPTWASFDANEKKFLMRLLELRPAGLDQEQRQAWAEEFLDVIYAPVGSLDLSAELHAIQHRYTLIGTGEAAGHD